LVKAFGLGFNFYYPVYARAIPWTMRFGEQARLSSQMLWFELLRAPVCRIDNLIRKVHWKEKHSLVSRHITGSFLGGIEILYEKLMQLQQHLTTI